MRARAIRGLGAALMIGVSVPAAAQDFDVMGIVEVLADGTPLALWVPFDRAEQEAYATRMAVGVMTTYSVTAFSGPPGDDIERPSLSLSFTVAGGTVRTGDLSYRTDGPDAPVYGAGNGIGTLSFDTLTIDGDTVAVQFEAEAVELDPSDHEPLEGGDRIRLDGVARVMLSD